MNAELERGAAPGRPAPLLHLPRHSRANLLVLGGTRSRRLAIAREYHQGSPLADESFLEVDCVTEEPRLVRALERWLLAGTAPLAEENDARDRVGALYLDPVAGLSVGTQRLLLMVACRLQGRQADSRPPGPARLMAGDSTLLVRAAEEGRFSGSLLDHLDKIRVDLGRWRSRGAA